MPRTLPAPGTTAGTGPLEELLQRSATVLKTHFDRTFPGAMVASLSVPWGDASESRAGYHLVWSRDLVESAGALIALGAVEEARQVLVYLMSTQQADGHWLQNQWLGGKPFWQGIQLDETGFPVLLAGLLADQKALGSVSVDDMIRRALTFIAHQGPVTGQDRWEEDAGLNTFTLAVAISGVLGMLLVDHGPWNKPKVQTAEVHNYGRDGLMAGRGNGGRSKNYEPNSFHGPVETGQPYAAGLEVQGESGTYDWDTRKTDDFTQAGDLYRLQPADARTRLVENIAGGLGAVSPGEVGDGIVERSIGHFRAADPEFGERVAQGVKERRG